MLSADLPSNECGGDYIIRKKKMECWIWKILTDFLRIENADIFRAIKGLRILTACSATARCIPGKTVREIPVSSKKTGKRLRTAPTAAFLINLKIMKRWCGF